MPKTKPSAPPAKPAPTDFQDSALLRESTTSLRALVREAAARLKLARSAEPTGRMPRSHGHGKGNGRSPASRY